MSLLCSKPWSDSPVLLRAKAQVFKMPCKSKHLASLFLYFYLTLFSPHFSVVLWRCYACLGDFAIPSAWKDLFPDTYIANYLTPFISGSKTTFLLRSILIILFQIAICPSPLTLTFLIPLNASFSFHSNCHL